MLGAIAMFPAAGLTISSLSLMGFLLVLGIIVDDATVVGERVYAFELEGMAPREAAIRGTSEVSVPVIFGVLTTQAAFLPIITLEGGMASFFAAVGLTVVLVPVLSLLESQLVLPAHLARAKGGAPGASDENWLERLQDRIIRAAGGFIADSYQPLMRRAVAHRDVVCALGVAVMLVMARPAGERAHRVPVLPVGRGRPPVCLADLPEGIPAEVTAAGRAPAGSFCGGAARATGSRAQ